MEYKDYYKTLGVAKNATENDIKKAYRKLAHQYHPDVSKESDAAARMAEINEAYTVLSDKEKRAAYDQLGDASQFQNGFTPPPNWGHGGFGGGFRSGDAQSAEHFSSFFEELFGRGGFSAQGFGGQGFGGQAQPRNQRGSDQTAEIELGLEESYAGATKELQLRSVERDAYGQPTEKTRHLQVTIPKGVYEGQTIRLAGKGNPGVGQGETGDLLLKVRFAQDKRWYSKGKDVYQQFELTPWQAALGGKIETKTLAGTLEVNVPEGVKSNSKLRVKGKGIPARQPGDLYLVIQITAPAPKNEEQRNAYEALAKTFSQ